MFILSDGDFFDDDGAQGIINGINNNCQDYTGLSQKKLLTRCRGSILSTLTAWPRRQVKF